LELLAQPLEYALNMKTSDFDYLLPKEFIAQSPAIPRDSARLMILDRFSGEIKHSVFNKLSALLNPGDLMIFNETKVIPARLYARKIPTGGKVELLLLRRIDDENWEALVGGKRLTLGKRIQILGGPEARIVDVLSGARRIIRFDLPIDDQLTNIGKVPLPPYIHQELHDPSQYQTVFAKDPGSAAAPTAGLHFTHRLMNEIKSKGIRIAYITLHVGLDTFAPIEEDSPEEHEIHTEWYRLPEETAFAINETIEKGGRIIAVGTTSVRALESGANSSLKNRTVKACEGATDLFILPGYKFKIVDAMITNFHLPKSSLIMLVSAFAGRKRILRAYEVAKNEGYRFYSFGDGMLIA